MAGDRRAPERTEWPTVAVAVGVYGGWAALLAFHEVIPAWLFLPLAAWIGAWSGSLQHETIHGHPTPWPTLNAALGWPPLTLWIPYCLYRESHLAHHRDDNLTWPGIDPESYYVSPERWARMGWFRRGLHRVNRTLAGRLLVGPAIVMSRTLVGAAEAVIAGTPGERLRWGMHLALVGIVLAIAVGWAGVPWYLYLLGFAYGGLSLTLLRSFAEHRAVASGSKTAIVRSGPLLSLLYLNNNLHHAHHAAPGAAWYELPKLADRLDSDREAARGAGLYRGYRDVARHWLLQPFDEPVHPLSEAACPDPSRPPGDATRAVTEGVRS